MENQVQNPFEEEKPKIVHLEKSQSHYEYCRMQMHDIEKAHRRTFLVHTAICTLVCALAVFHVYIAGFDVLSRPLAAEGTRGLTFAAGIFEVVIAMGSILLGYLAWANFHTLNIIQACWYFVVTFLGIWRLDYISAVFGIVGLVFYFFSLKEMGHEAQLAEMEGYPDFQERFDISQSDIVIQTLLAHKGEHRTKSTLFTTDYSLRRKKKKRPTDEPEEKKKDPTKELALEIRKRLEQVEAAKHPENQKKAAEEQPQAVKEIPAAEEMPDIVNEPVQESAETAASVPAEEQAAADAIIAEAEAKAKAILEQALAEAEKVKADAAKAQSAPSLQKKPQNAHPAGGKNPHPNGNRPQNRQNPRRNSNQS